MKQSNFTEVQIVKILSEQNQGKTVNEICREHGISQPVIFPLLGTFKSIVFI